LRILFATHVAKFRWKAPTKSYGRLNARAVITFHWRRRCFNVMRSTQPLRSTGRSRSTYWAHL